VKYLVDANVLSETTKPDPSPSVVARLRAHESQLVVNPIILGELEYGILLLPNGQRRKRLEKWLAEGVRRLQVVDFKVETASCWARLIAELKKRGRVMPVKDSLIAASALEYRLTIVTRNVADFQYAKVNLYNPFAT
jgi:toxin FitB